MVHGVSVIWFPVSDVDRSVGFYRDTLGLELERQDNGWAHLSANGVNVGLNEREPTDTSGGGVLAFQPEGSLDEAVEDLRQKGVEIAGVSDEPWGRIATFKDPDGHDLQLYEPPGG